MFRKKGFTLIELIMVIVIIGILAAIAVPKFVSLREEARRSRCQSDVSAIRTAISNWYATYSTKCDSAVIGGTTHSVCKAGRSNTQGFPLNAEVSSLTSYFGVEFFSEQRMPPTGHITTLGVTGANKHWAAYYTNTTGAMNMDSYCVAK